MLRNFLTASILSLTATMASAQAETNAFQDGWTIDQAASSLNFLSVKKGKLMELSRFDTVEGNIDEDGNVTLTVPLDSIDTSVDLRNVRMRFLFFETFQFPDATITTQLTEEMLADLETVGTKTITLPFTMALHGVEQQMNAEVLVSLISRNRVSVSSVAPIIIKVEDFGLMGGLAKLEAAAEVVIVPTTSVTFNFAFDRNGTAMNPPEAPLAMARATTALEPTGAFSREACKIRFDILSRTGNIYFTTGQAELVDDSAPLLNSVAYIVEKCADMRIAISGHTDSRGSVEGNERLSRERAEAVVGYMVGLGLPRNRFVAQGFGEMQPIATNETAEGRRQNRRISFSIADYELALNSN